jgi:hypothetical protein
MQLRVTAYLGIAALMAVLGPGTAHAAEYGTGPGVKGYTDIFGGVMPPAPGLYARTDAYHYQGSADTTIFNGRIALNVEEEYLATLMALTYVTPWKILGGTYAFAVAPSVVAMDVNVGIQIPAFTGPRGNSFVPSISTPVTPSLRKAIPPSRRSCLAGMPATSTGTSPCSVSRRPASTIGSSWQIRA